MIKPKCLPPGKKEIAYTTTGHIVPCCWLDNPLGWEEPQIKRLYQDKLKVSNNKDIESIVDSKEWNDFFKELKTNPSETCTRFCSGPIDSSINRARENEHKPGKIKICTLYFEGKYTPDYVEKLYNSLKRNCTIPFEFICYSDNPNVKADVVIPLVKHSDIKLHWYKLSYFSPLFANQNPNDEIIIMDIDQIIVGNVDDMIGYPVGDNELVSYNKWWGGKPTYNLKLNGGFYKFKSGHLKKIWDDFILAPEDWQLDWYNRGVVHYKYYGEQNYVNHKCKEHNIKLTLMPAEWVCKLTNNEKEDIENQLKYMKKFNKDYMILDKPIDDLKVVHFANPHANIHNSKYDWIKDYWK
tara:strand:+ start:4970 stop:6028 length:1059 start_codon:yes stop_codon:yes gene_type:complete